MLLVKPPQLLFLLFGPHQALCHSDTFKHNACKTYIVSYIACFYLCNIDDPVGHTVKRSRPHQQPAPTVRSSQKDLIVAGFGEKPSISLAWMVLDQEKARTRPLLFQHFAHQDIILPNFIWSWFRRDCSCYASASHSERLQKMH